MIPAAPEAGHWPRTTIATDAREEGLAATDVDGDGDVDVLGFLAPQGRTVVWWENPGTGTAGWRAHPVGATEHGEGDRIGVCDVNHDGKVDVVVTETNQQATGNGLYWFSHPARSSQALWVRTRVASDWGSLNPMDVGDVNGDGSCDIVTGEHRGALRVTVWANDGRGGFMPHVIATAVESHLGTRLVDLDRDGDLDLVSMAWDRSTRVHLWRNDARQRPRS